MIPIKDILIEKVALKDISQLKEISENTFFDTYASQNTEADMRDYLLENFSVESLKKQFENPESFFYFARFQQEIIGYLKINKGKAQTDLLLENALEIERIYITENFQGKGVGKLLLNYAIAQAIKMKLERLWLGVWEKNTNAIGFYKKHGFVPFANHHFMVGTDEQWDVLMKLELN